MIDCSKTENYFNEKLRITKSTKSGICKINCRDCPLYSENNDTSEGLSCRCLEMYYPEKAVKAVQRWSDEHPPRTYLTELLKSFPNTPLDVDGTPDSICPYDLGLTGIDACRKDHNCVKCWNQPLPIKGDEE